MLHVYNILLFYLKLLFEKRNLQTLVFQGKKVTWLTVFSLEELLDLKVKYPQAPLVVGNTSIGKWNTEKAVVFSANVLCSPL